MVIELKKKKTKKKKTQCSKFKLSEFWPKVVISGNDNGIYIPHFLYLYNQMRFTFNHPTHES